MPRRLRLPAFVPAALAFAAFLNSAQAALNVRLNLDKPGPEISPLIFGVNFATEEHIRDAGIVFSRYGGNRHSRWDWKTGNDAAGHDWFYVNGGANEKDPSKVWFNEALVNNRKRGVQTLFTVPMSGWVAKDNNSSSYSVAKYGEQEKTDAANGHPDWGNGIKKGGGRIKNDPRDASKKAGPAYQKGFAAFIKKTYGPASTVPAVHYALDNEPGLWDSTHHDIHPEQTGYDEIWSKTVAYATAIKKADPSAMVWGPVEWGWLGIKNTASDKGSDGKFETPEDSIAHGTDFFLKWYIQQLAAHKKKTGKLLVDVIDVHDYPEVYAGDDGRIVMGSKGWDGGSNSASQKARLLAARTWWDPTYKPSGAGGTSWISEPIYLLRRIQGYIKEYLPELKLAVTEWNFGGNPTLNGALTHALVFKALMQEGAYAAAEWGPPKPKDPAFYAYKMFRNYDGNGGAFSGDFIQGEGGSADLNVFGAYDSAKKILRIAVVNSDPKKIMTVTLDPGRYIKGQKVRTFVLDQKSPTKIREAKALSPSGGKLSYTAPAYSLSMLELPLP